MALFSPIVPTALSTLPTKSSLFHRPQFSQFPKKSPTLFLTRSADNGAGTVGSTSTTSVEEKLENKKEETLNLVSEEEKKEESIDANGAAVKAEVPAFKDPKWVAGTWDLKQFEKGKKTDWDAVIDSEARRRKWLQDNPEASSNEEPVVFDTSIIPWWSWIKRFHLPEAELLNGRAAMIGFFMAYFVDSLTGMGLVDQTGNFFCKTLLFIAVVGVLFIRKNEDIENLKKLLDETTFYDKQWQATWQEDDSSDLKKK